VEHRQELFHGDRTLFLQLGRERHIVIGQPQLTVPSQLEVQDHLTGSDPLQLGDALLDVVPVVHRQDRHRRVEGPVGERQPLGTSLDRWCNVRGTLIEHPSHEVDGDDRTVGRFVRAWACAHVHDRSGVTERAMDLALDPRIGTAPLGVADPDPLVVRHTGRTPCLRQGRVIVLPLDTCRPFQMAMRVSAGSMMSSTWAWPAAM